ncbi:MAG: hypothetical protein JWQ90_3968 [Hydrocarboniphaga sp.]|uniref:DUF7064 domain-containing protein n=1 Tax=Hydrocarboniphaga sp. TaxID=2033016 RepID=UPI00262206F0|nr:hypothetical protein [Hydrocarboniphaga sp.]MDB5971518.1 hypothetical protein [Hydrocarboniphaga sp.]
MRIEAVAIDEYPITEIPSTAQWSENYALMFGDPISRTSVYYSIGRCLADPTIWRELIGFVLPDRKVLFSKNYARGGSATGPGGGLSRLDVLVPARKLRLSFEGPVTESTQEELIDRGYRDGPKGFCKAEVIFDARMPIWNMKGDSREAGTIAGSMHIEQIGTANGVIRFGGNTYPLTDGYAVRDHSRGVRDVSQYRMHGWINGSFDDGRAFAVYAMQLQGSDTFGMSNAAVFKNGEQYPAELLRTDMAVGTEDPGRLHTLVLGSALGEMEISVVEVLTSFANSMVRPFDMCPGKLDHTSSAFMLDQLVRFECDGHKGVGWTERGLARQALT